MDTTQKRIKPLLSLKIAQYAAILCCILLLAFHYQHTIFQDDRLFHNEITERDLERMHGNDDTPYHLGPEISEYSARLPTSLYVEAWRIKYKITGDESWISYFQIFLFLISLIAISSLIATNYGMKRGILFLIIMLSSGVVLNTQIYTWHVGMLPIFTVLFTILFYLFYRSKNIYYFLPIGMVASTALTLHVTGLSLFIGALVAVVLSQEKIKSLMLLGAGYAMILMPYIVGDAFRGLENTLMAIRILGIDSSNIHIAGIALSAIFIIGYTAIKTISMRIVLTGLALSVSALSIYGAYEQIVLDDHSAMTIESAQKEIADKKCEDHCYDSDSISDITSWAYEKSQDELVSDEIENVARFINENSGEGHYFWRTDKTSMEATPYIAGIKAYDGKIKAFLKKVNTQNKSSLAKSSINTFGGLYSKERAPDISRLLFLGSSVLLSLIMLSIRDANEDQLNTVFITTAVGAIAIASMSYSYEQSGEITQSASEYIHFIAYFFIAYILSCHANIRWLFVAALVKATAFIFIAY